jgi:hypothetical protein
MLDVDEFFSDNGIRSLSKYHEKHPYAMDVNGQKFRVSYISGDSNNGLFGGNSNWRGPIWICVNFLLVESFQRFYMFYGQSLKVECPTDSGDFMHLGHVSEDIQHDYSICLREERMVVELSMMETICWILIRAGETISGFMNFSMVIAEVG